MSKAVIREGDYHVGHAGPDVPFHRTAYVSNLQNKVFIDHKPVIVVGDKTTCGDPAVEGSGKVFVGGHPVHREGDATGGHDPWVPNQADTLDTKVSVD